MRKALRLFERLVQALLVAGAVAASAAAQPSAPSAQPTSPGCSGTQLQPREGPNPQLRDGGGGNLSDQLARSEGVICPPPVDPAIKAPTPSTGDSSVVPPPGSPGGDPTVRPK